MLFRNIIVFAGIFLALVGCKKEHIEYYEDNLTIKKTYFTDGEDGPIIGEFKEYRSNGDLKEIRNYRDGVLEGKSYWFWKNDTVYEKNYLNGKLEGMQKFRIYNIFKVSEIFDSIQEYHYTAGKYVPNVEKGTFVDSRDSVLYKTISIGGQTWMAENLRYKTKGSYCYAGKKENCEIYGRLYTQKAAKTACPEGWKLFSENDFLKLSFNSNGLLEFEEKKEKDEKISLKLKVDLEYNLKSLSNWPKDKNGGDKVGFSLLPSGYYCPQGVEQETYQYFPGYRYNRKTQYSFALGSVALLWSQEKGGLPDSYFIGSEQKTSYKARCGGGGTPIALAVRCIKNN